MNSARGLLSSAFTVLCLFLFPISVISSERHLTYAQLGFDAISKNWNVFSEAAEPLESKKVLPHETKLLRKDIANLRESLDLFVYAYPVHKKDTWQKIRKDLDKGYELIGSFKDLYDVQGLSDSSKAEYSNKEVEPLREDVLKWWKGWKKSAPKYLDYLANPDSSEIHVRSKDILSRFYWGASEMTPDLEISGLENMSRLISDLIYQAQNDWQEVQEIKNPAEDEELEIRFHDLRKRIRSITRIIRAFPELYTGPEDLLVLAEEMSTSYGAINDLILQHKKLLTDDKDKKAHKVMEQIEEEWLKLVKKQKSADFFNELQSIQGFLI